MLVGCGVSVTVVGHSAQFHSGSCICDEKAALDIRSVNPNNSTVTVTVTVILEVGLKNSERCVCCPNVTLAYRYCAWSNASIIPRNISGAEINNSLPWNSWIRHNPLCIDQPSTILIANLPSSNYYVFQVAPHSTGQGPTTALKYFRPQGMTSASFHLCSVYCMCNDNI